MRALVPYGLVGVLGGTTVLLLTTYVDRLPGSDRIGYRDQGALLLVAACILLCWVSFHLHLRRAPTFAFSRVRELMGIRRRFLSWLAPAPRALRIVVMGLLAFALARPQTTRRDVIQVEGVDIMLVLDLSKSMEETDMIQGQTAVDRLRAAQETISRFLDGRQNDRIGLVVFAKQAMIQCPPTLDYDALDAILADLSIGDVEPMGTAIGDGLGLALATFRRSKVKSKVVILLTDGDSNVVNEMSPEEARDQARAMRIKVFSVLVGKEADSGGFDPFGRKPYGVNPGLLKQMAAETGGRYFNAADAESLNRGFEEVRALLEKDKMEKIGVVHTDLYPLLIAPALGLVLLELLLSLTRLRSFP